MSARLLRAGLALALGFTALPAFAQPTERVSIDADWKHFLGELPGDEAEGFD